MAGLEEGRHTGYSQFRVARDLRTAPRRAAYALCGGKGQGIIPRTIREGRAGARQPGQTRAAPGESDCGRRGRVRGEHDHDRGIRLAVELVLQVLLAQRLPTGSRPSAAPAKIGLHQRPQANNRQRFVAKCANGADAAFQPRRPYGARRPTPPSGTRTLSGRFRWRCRSGPRSGGGRGYRSASRRWSRPPPH